MYQEYVISIVVIVVNLIAVIAVILAVIVVVNLIKFTTITATTITATVLNFGFLNFLIQVPKIYEISESSTESSETTFEISSTASETSEISFKSLDLHNIEQTPPLNLLNELAPTLDNICQWNAYKTKTNSEKIYSFALDANNISETEKAFGNEPFLIFKSMVNRFEVEFNLNPLDLLDSMNEGRNKMKRKKTEIEECHF